MEETAVEADGPIFDPPVYIQRYTIVRDILYRLPGIERVVDFGCAEGKFIKYLKKLPFVKEIVGVDLEETCLHRAAYCSRPIAWDFIYKRHSSLFIKIFNGNIAQKDCRLEGFDAVTCIELIEHLEPNALNLLPENVFGFIRPKIAIFTTPNSEFNVLFQNLKGFRHWDHKFEWCREEFQNWCASVIDQYPEYDVDYKGIGECPTAQKLDLGCCTQMAIFRLKDKAKEAATKNSIGFHQPYTLIEENKFPGREQTEDLFSSITLEDTFMTLPSQ